MTQQSLITQLKSVEEALKGSNFWLKGCLLCEEFRWDYEQRECAEGVASSGEAALSDLRELIKEAETEEARRNACYFAGTGKWRTP